MKVSELQAQLKAQASEHADKVSKYNEIVQETKVEHEEKFSVMKAGYEEEIKKLKGLGKRKESKEAKVVPEEAKMAWHGSTFYKEEEANEENKDAEANWQNLVHDGKFNISYAHSALLAP